MKVLLLLVSTILIILVLLQSGKATGINQAFSGSGLGLFANVKERGSEKIISNLTLIFGIIFFILVIVERLLTKA